MKLFTAAFLTETNTWSPVPTGMNAFKVDKPFYRRDGSLQPVVGGGNGVLAFTSTLDENSSNEAFGVNNIALS